MDLSIPSEFEQFVRDEVVLGNYASAAEVVEHALRLLKEQTQLRGAVRAATAQLDRGEALDGSEVFQELRSRAEAIARRGP